MADQSNNWPLPKFYFSVDLGIGQTISFQEVTGLEAETQVIEYRQGDNKAFSTVKLPGITKYGNVTMKKGVFSNDNNFWTWYQKAMLRAEVQRTTVNIKLLDQSGKVTMQWTLANAWPTKIQGTDLKSDGNEVAVETIEIAHEGLTIANPGS